MMRWFWLASGPLVIILAGFALLRALPEEEVKKSVEPSSISLPSGLEARFHEMLWNEPGQGLAYRFRFVAPDFRQTDEVEHVVADLQYLCSEFALSRMANTGPLPGQVIISLADKPSVFGTYDPEVIQVFEAFSVKDGACIWEAF